MFILLITLFQIYCSQNIPTDVDSIYLNGKILLMNDTKPTYADMVAVKNTTIVYVGTTYNLLKMIKKDGTTNVINLKGRTLMPGFIDVHSHLTFAAYTPYFCNLSSNPTSNTQNFTDLISSLNLWKSNPNSQFILNITGWMIGYNYDITHKQLSLPNATILNLISNTTPILVIHKTLSIGSLNSAGLTKLNLTLNNTINMTKTYHLDNFGNLSGIISQDAFTSVLVSIFSNIPIVNLTSNLLNQITSYVENGFTTIQDGKTDQLGLDLLIKTSINSLFQVDVYSNLDYIRLINNTNNTLNVIYKQYISKNYTKGFRINGAKMILDGAIHLETASFKIPYYNVYSVYLQSVTKNYSGNNFQRVGSITTALNIMAQYNLQPIFHVNGDSAIQQLINQTLFFQDNTNQIPAKPNSYPFNFTNLDNYRITSVHSSGLNVTQINQMIIANIIPSFYTVNLLTWGDWHNSITLGAIRTASLDPAGSAVNNSMLFTEHNDYPVNSLNPFKIISSAVNRLTGTGITIGINQQIAVYYALLSLTRYAAYQIFEENHKGCICVGYSADFIILSENPLAVNANGLSNIRVVSTVKNGTILYKIF